MAACSKSQTEGTFCVKSFWEKHRDKIQCIALMSSIALNFFLTYNQLRLTEEYYRPALQLQQSLQLKKSELVLLVDPSNDFLFTAYGNGSWTVTNTTISIKPGASRTFRLFVCNIGNSAALLQYLFVYYHIAYSENGSRTVTHCVSLEGRILRPFETFEYSYTVSTAPEWAESQIKTYTGKGHISFAIMTNETIISKTVSFLVEEKRVVPQ